MPVIETEGRKIEVDDQGFLVASGTWNEKVALALAAREGLSALSAEQLAIIDFMRKYYQEFHAFPILRAVCRNLNRPRECVSEAFIDPMKAWKIAGLPNPEIIASESADEAGAIYRILVGD